MPCGLVVQRELDAEHVRPPEDLVPLDELDAVALLQLREALDVPVERRHLEGLGDPGHRPRDLAHAEQAERQVADVDDAGEEPPGVERRRGLHVAALAGQPLGPVEDEGPDVLGDGDVVDQRRRRDRDAALAAAASTGHAAVVLPEVLDQSQLVGAGEAPRPAAAPCGARGSRRPR